MVSGVKTPEQLAQEFVDRVDVPKTEPHFGCSKSDSYAAEMLNSHGNQRMRLKEGFLAGYAAAKAEAIAWKEDAERYAKNAEYWKAQAAAPQWISVKDRLPEDGAYLVSYKGYMVSLAELITRTDSSRYWNIVDPYCISCTDVLSRYDDPTHWMPLPKLPTEG